MIHPAANITDISQKKILLLCNEKLWHYNKLEMRSVECGICPTATSIINEVFQ